jgi:hypothetical protein
MTDPIEKDKSDGCEASSLVQARAGEHGIPKE